MQWNLLRRCKKNLIRDKLSGEVLCLMSETQQIFHSVAIACDHAACELKDLMMSSDALSSYVWLDFGCASSQRSVDYPDYAQSVVKAIAGRRVDVGICLCGSGIGMSMAANRDPKMRAAVVWNKSSAVLSRQHNNANILCLGSRMLTSTEAVNLARIWLSTPFQGGRHKKRLEKFCEFI